MDVYGSLGSLGAVSGIAVVSGIQQLDQKTRDDVLTLLGKRVLVTDPNMPAAQGVFNFVAVTMERLAQLGLQTSEATKNAAKYVEDLPSGNYTLANVNDVTNLAIVQDFHITVASAEAVPLIAGSGSSLAVLNPLAPVETGATTPGEKKFSIVTPVIGAGIGLLVGGPVGAAVGAAVGLGVEAVRTAA